MGLQCKSFVAPSFRMEMGDVIYAYALQGLIKYRTRSAAKPIKHVGVRSIVGSPGIVFPTPLH